MRHRYVPFVALERTMLNVRSDVDENMIPPLVRLTAPLDIAAELREKFATLGEASRESLKEGLVELAARIQSSESFGAGA